MLGRLLTLLLGCYIFRDMLNFQGVISIGSTAASDAASSPPGCYSYSFGGGTIHSSGLFDTYFWKNFSPWNLLKVGCYWDRPPQKIAKNRRGIWKGTPAPKNVQTFQEIWELVKFRILFLLWFFEKGQLLVIICTWKMFRANSSLKYHDWSVWCFFSG